MAGYVPNPLQDPARGRPAFNFARAFHARLPGYAPTPLLEVPELAAELGIGQLWVKDESARFGLPSHECLGAGWALYRVLLGRLGRRPPRWQGLEELRPHLEALAPVRVLGVGYEGFGIGAARAARWLGAEATVLLTREPDAGWRSLLDEEGAEFEITEPEAVADRVAAARRDGHAVLSELPRGDEECEEGEAAEVPRWVAEGEVTIFEEVADELDARGAPAPDAVVVGLGTGTLAAAAATSWRTEQFPESLRLIGVEPAESACFTASLEVGEPASVEPAAPPLGALGPGSCAPEALAMVARAFDGVAQVDAPVAIEAVGIAGHHGIRTTPTGAAGLAALVGWAQGDLSDLPFGADSSVLVVNAEGLVARHK